MEDKKIPAVRKSPAAPMVRAKNQVEVKTEKMPATKKTASAPMVRATASTPMVRAKNELSVKPNGDVTAKVNHPIKKK